MTTPATIDIATIPLLSGHHRDIIADNGGCIMDVVAFVAGTPGTDTPPCVSAPLARAMQRLNDWMRDDERELLRPYITRVQDTVGTPEQDRERAYICADWACRTLMPLILRRINRQEDATRCEALAPVVDKETSRVASAAMREQRKLLTGLYAAAADAAAAAAYAYAYAAYAAAAYAAAAAAYAAAAAPLARRELITLRLQLIDRLIAVTAPVEVTA